MSAGRPSKYKKEFCDQVIELGKVGASRAEICLELGICPNTLKTWEETKPQFMQATTYARQMAQGWWEKQGRKGVWGGSEFNANAYRLQVTNRFPKDWRDKVQNEHSGPEGSPIEISDVSENATAFRRAIIGIAARNPTNKDVGEA